MNNIIKMIVKILISGAIAFFILNVFCLFYFFRPLSITDYTKATSYRLDSSKKYSVMIEGWGIGQTNDDGCNNLMDLADIDKIDILVM